MPFEDVNQMLSVDEGQQQQHFEDVSLLSQDELHERNVLRVLLEYGLHHWTENKTIAQHIFEELDAFTFDNQQLENLLNVYRSLFYKGEPVNTKYFLYNDDKALSDLVTSITLFPFELSLNWDKVLEGMNITNRDTSIEDVTMSLNYFKLKKLKTMLLQNQNDLEKSTNFDEQKQLLEVHKSLKEIEREITKQLGTVIFK